MQNSQSLPACKCSYRFLPNGTPAKDANTIPEQVLYGNVEKQKADYSPITPVSPIHTNGPVNSLGRFPAWAKGSYSPPCI